MARDTLLETFMAVDTTVFGYPVIGTEGRLLVAVLGGYAWTTKRDLSGLRTYLGAALLAVIVASLVGLFFQAPLFHLLLAVPLLLVIPLAPPVFLNIDFRSLDHAEHISAD